MTIGQVRLPRGGDPRMTIPRGAGTAYFTRVGLPRIEYHVKYEVLDTAGYRIPRKIRGFRHSRL